MSDVVTDRIKTHEKLRLKVYDDATGKEIGPGTFVKGHPTIGWGRALDTNGITEEEASYLFTNDYLRVRRQLEDWAPWARKQLNQARYDVLIEMAFQNGIIGLMRFKRFLALLKTGLYTQAAAEGMDSKWAREQSPVRAAELMSIIETGVAD